MELVLPPTDVLLRPSPKDRPRAALRGALLPRLREVLASVCLWAADSAIGDHAFCVLSYNPRRNVQVYLQLWSEPDDVVMWEVSSGNWHEPTKAYMRDARSDAVRRTGFRIGGRARNFQRQLQVETPEHVDALAEAVVDLHLRVDCRQRLGVVRRQPARAAGRAKGSAAQPMKTAERVH
jgi:hypothetical protein